MSGMYYNNPYANPWAAQNIQQMPSQYGVDTSSQALQGMSGMASMIPYIGPLLGAGMNMIAQAQQNSKQEEFYKNYMSPQARMAQMRAAGINPNAAAQGIAGSAAPQMNAAAPTGAFSSIGEALGQSENTALTAKAIEANIRNVEADTAFKDSLNVEKQTTNKYLDAMQNATLRNLVNQGDITKHQASILAVDDYYHGAEAAAHLEQTYMAIEKMAAEIQNEEQTYYNLLAQEYATMQAGQLSEAQIHKVFSDIGLNNAQIGKIAHECENIDASTMAITQSISESKARERLTRVQAQEQEKYLSIWNNSGYNMKSDVNANFHQMVASGNSAGAKQILNGTKAMIINEGDANFSRRDYSMDKAIDLIGSASRLFMIPAPKAPASSVKTIRNAKGQVTQTIAQDYYQ